MIDLVVRRELESEDSPTAGLQGVFVGLFDLFQNLLVI